MRSSVGAKKLNALMTLYKKNAACQQVQHLADTHSQSSLTPLQQFKIILILASGNSSEEVAEQLAEQVAGIEDPTSFITAITQEGVDWSIDSDELSRFQDIESVSERMAIIDGEIVSTEQELADLEEEEQACTQELQDRQQELTNLQKTQE